jgi:hypothetical protein
MYCLMTSLSVRDCDLAIISFTICDGVFSDGKDTGSCQLMEQYRKASDPWLAQSCLGVFLNVRRFSSYSAQ